LEQTYQQQYEQLIIVNMELENRIHELQIQIQYLKGEMEVM
jgi:hypothetical protein